MAALDSQTGFPLDELLRRAVTEWRERHGMSARRFGTEALGDPDFVFSQERGRSVRLVTADRVLVFMGRPPLGPAFRGEVEAFLCATGTKVAVLGEEAAGNPSFVGRLRRGASPQLRTVDRVRTWMAAHTSVEEAQAIRSMVTEDNPFAGAMASGSSNAAGPPAGSGAESEQEGGTGMNGNGKYYLNTREAAAWLNLSPRTLDGYRVSGEGPVFHRFGGRVRYLIADLEEWAWARRRISTSDDGGALRRGGAMRMHVLIIRMAAVLVWALWSMEAAWATMDTTFAGPLGTVTDIVEGTGGQLAEAVGVGIAAGAGTGADLRCASRGWSGSEGVPVVLARGPDGQSVRREPLRSTGHDTLPERRSLGSKYGNANSDRTPKEDWPTRFINHPRQWEQR